MRVLDECCFIEHFVDSNKNACNMGYSTDLSQTCHLTIPACFKCILEANPSQKVEASSGNRAICSDNATHLCANTTNVHVTVMYMSLIHWIISCLCGESFMEVILKGRGNFQLIRPMGRVLEKIICAVSKRQDSRHKLSFNDSHRPKNP
jgi:hypothetical protein